jgi:hypothetical protein
MPSNGSRSTWSLRRIPKRVAAALVFLGGVAAGITLLFDSARTVAAVFDDVRSKPTAPETRSAATSSMGTEVAQPAGLVLSTDVSRKGTKQWRKELRVVPGEVVSWRMRAANSGPSPLLDVVTRTVLAPHLSLISGSMHFLNARADTSLPDARLFFESGYNAGRYNPGDDSYYLFDTKVVDDFPGCSTRVRTYGVIRARGTGAITHSMPSTSADVVIGKTKC